jgi:hypothetical protein
VLRAEGDFTCWVAAAGAAPGRLLQERSPVVRWLLGPVLLSDTCRRQWAQRAHAEECTRHRPYRSAGAA